MGCLTSGYRNKESAKLREFKEQAEAAAAAAAAAALAAAPAVSKGSTPIVGQRNASQATESQELSDLPPCVRRYLDKATVTDSKPTIVTSSQRGEFRYEPNGAWHPMIATQRFSPLVPAFFWSTRCRYKPLMWLKGFDCLVRGKGTIFWRLWGWLPAQDANGPMLDKATLARWLAEAPGCPQALLPSAFLRWEAVPGSDTEARAVVTHDGMTVSGVFAFDEEGLLTSFYSDDYVRPLPRGGGVLQQRWVCRYRGHRSVQTETAGSGTDAAGASSVFVPTEGEALWVQPDGEEFSYCRFQVTRLEVQ